MLGYAQMKMLAQLMVSTLILPACAAGSCGDLLPQDRKMLEVLRSAQLASEAAFPRASLKANVEDGYSNQRAVVTAVWDGDRYFCDAEIEDTVTDSDGVQTVSKRLLMQIGKPSGWDYYFPGTSSLLQRVSDGGMTGPKLLNIRPKDIWFHFAPESPWTWSQRLEMQLGPDSPWDTQLNDLGSGLIEVSTVSRASKDRFVVTFSMPDGGNVLEYHSEPVSEDQEFRLRGKYEWVSVPPDRWRLKSYVFQISKKEDTDYDKYKQKSVEVLEFDPDPVIASNRFEISSLPLPPGTYVEEYGANERRYRIGGDKQPEKGISESKFESLALELKQVGFGAKK